MNKLLPGLRVKTLSVFDLEVGTKIYDKSTDKYGIISDIRETGYEVIDAFILLDGETTEVPVWRMPEAIIIGSAA